MLLLLSSLSTQPGNFWIHPRVFEGEAEDFNEICILSQVEQISKICCELQVK